LIAFLGGAAATHACWPLVAYGQEKVRRIYPYMAAGGGLVSYGVHLVEQYRRAASYVDRVLRGEKPGDLPVQKPTKYNLAVNLKTAKALGISLPHSLLTRAEK
jgi:putative ABC transport system substrate-binding protein